MSESQNIIIVTGGETFIGYNIALRLCDEIDRRRSSKNYKVRVLCSNKDGLDKLEKRGAELHVVRYEDQENLRQHLRHVSLVVLTLNDREQRARDARNIIECAQQERCQSIQLISHIGCDRTNENQRGLYDFQEVEECLKNKYQNGRWVILRLNFVQQWFYLWSPMIEDHGKLRLNVKEDSKFAPVSMNDVLDACMKVASKNQNDEEFCVFEQYHQKTFQFTGRDAVNAREIARELSRAVEGRQIQFEPISMEDMKQYFEEIRQDQRMLISSMQVFEKSSQDSQSKHDKDNLIPQGKYLTDSVINQTLSYLELVRENQVNEATSDIHKVTGNEPISLKNFFKDNRDQFRGR
ncbi:hypothetical protein BC943DRAFT_350305 [Umbelopsis sp. AD052]|nr:hypothetical protein BC943DRAFT_350305 [Umbelopsis sp. AD052]